MKDKTIVKLSLIIKQLYKQGDMGGPSTRGGGVRGAEGTAKIFEHFFRNLKIFEDFLRFFWKFVNKNAIKSDFWGAVG